MCLLDFILSSNGVLRGWRRPYGAAGSRIRPFRLISKLLLNLITALATLLRCRDSLVIVCDLHVYAVDLDHKLDYQTVTHHCVP